MKDLNRVSISLLYKVPTVVYCCKEFEEYIVV